MKFCLSCRQLSSSRDLTSDALFCPHCGRSFGVRRCKSCKKKPSSPRDASYCVHCGGTKLTDGTAYFDLNWLTLLLTFAAGIVAIRWIWLDLDIGTSITTMARNCFILVYGFCVYWAVFLACTYFLLGLVPGEMGGHLRKLYGKALGSGWKLVQVTLGKAGTILYKMLLQLLDGGRKH